MEPTTTKPSLKDLLNRKATPSKEEAGPSDLSATIHPIFALMAQIEKITESAIAEATGGLVAPEGEAPAKSRKEIQSAIQTALALSPSETPKEVWEAATQAEILKGLREKIASRVTARNRRAFQNRSDEEMETLIKALTLFRTASKPEEIAYCSRELMPPGPARLGRATHTKSRSGEFPQEVEEIIYALIQFRLAAEKNLRPQVTAAEAQALKNASIVLQNPRGPMPEIPEETRARAERTPGASEEFIKIVGGIFDKIQPDEKSKEAIAREVELFGSAADDVGTELEALQGIQREEFVAVRELEKQFAVMEAAQPPKTWARPETPEETNLRIFQALREAAPAMGKATTMNLTAQLARDPEWVSKFHENGVDTIYEAKSFKSHVVLTEPENALFGQPSKTEDYVAEGRGILEAVALVDQAEQMLYTDPLISAISARDRESALYCARHLLSDEVPQEEIGKRPMLKKIEETRALAEGLSAAILAKIEGGERNLARLPMALRERERLTRAEAAMTRIIQSLSDPDVQATVASLLADELTNLDQLLENKNPDESDARARVYCEEKIATLEAITDIAEGASDLDEKTYGELLAVATAQAIPMSLKDHAMVTLCDNKSRGGVRVKTKEILERIENLTGQKGLTTKVRGALGTLRRWKEREMATPVSRTDLAGSICSCPKELKTLIGKELKVALKSCLEASPWKDPFVANPKDISSCNANYLMAKSEYADDPETFRKLRALHAATAEIVKSANGSGWLKGQKFAEAFSSNDPEGLRSKENAALEAALAAKNPGPAVRYLASWYNAVGNERRLAKDAFIDEPWKIEHLPLAGAKIQTKIENLMEIASYSKAVATNPEALAEAYIQHSLHERRSGAERWDLRIERMLAKNNSDIDRSKKELEDWTTKFNAVFDDSGTDELTEDELSKRDATKVACHRKIGQKERELEALLMKGEKLRELRDTTKAINGAATAEEMVAALEERGASAGVVNLGSVLDKALVLADSAGKLNLPKNGQVNAFQILEGAAVEESLGKCRKILDEARGILTEHQPAIKTLETEENPREAARELKKAAFRTLKDIEVLLWETGKSVDMAEEELEAFIKENPELIANRKSWVETLKKTQTDMAGAVEIAAAEPQRKKKGPKKDEPDMAGAAAK